MKPGAVKLSRPQPVQVWIRTLASPFVNSIGAAHSRIPPQLPLRRIIHKSTEVRGYCHSARLLSTSTIPARFSLSVLPPGLNLVAPAATSLVLLRRIIHEVIEVRGYFHVTGSLSASAAAAQLSLAVLPAVWPWLRPPRRY